MSPDHITVTERDEQSARKTLAAGAVLSTLDTEASSAIHGDRAALQQMHSDHRGDTMGFMMSPIDVLKRRFFTRTANGEAPKSPFDFCTFETCDIRVYNKQGVRFAQDGCVFPVGWSSLARQIVAEKYFRKRGVPSETRPVPENCIINGIESPIPERYQRREPAPGATFGGEHDIRQTIHRIVGAWTYHFLVGGYCSSIEEADYFYDEVAYAMVEQMLSPNSPQWFNTGLDWAYGIKAKSAENWRLFPADAKNGRMQPKIVRNAYEHPQASACFISSLEDKLIGPDGIHDLLAREGKIFKYGSGNGANFSALRAENEPLSGGGVSSGLMTFLKIFDTNAGSMQSGGTTRRAAKMVVVDADHPDIEKFISWKLVEETKVAMLAAGSRALRGVLDGELSMTMPPTIARRMDNIRSGKALGDDFPLYDIDFENEAYRTVSGQNSNNSVRVNESFMRAARDDSDWNLTRRTDGAVAKTVKARLLLSAMAYCAANVGDPGIHFADNINRWHTCKADGEIRASNPCSEYMFLDETACNLASLRLTAFQKAGYFDLEAFAHASGLMCLILEISVAMGSFPSQKVALNSYLYRTLGGGLMDVGAMFLAWGIPYDSDTARTIASLITSAMTATMYATSHQVAKRMGAFDRYEANRESVHDVMRMHMQAHERIGGLNGAVPSSIADSLRQSMSDVRLWAQTMWREVVNGTREGQAGLRNAQASLMAPTGTIGLQTDCNTTGLEPVYSHVAFKQLVGGLGTVRIVNKLAAQGLRALGYDEETIDKIGKQAFGHQQVSGCPVLSAEFQRKMQITHPIMDALDAAAKSKIKVEHIFSKDTLPAEVLQAAGVTEADLATEAGVFNRMFTDEAERTELATYIFGTGAINASPLLKREHYAVFDTAGKANGRSISAPGHVDMMVAMQPFLSGAISKTVNLPAGATTEDVLEVFWRAYDGGLKAIAIYVDGSKLSQPLKSDNADIAVFTLKPTGVAAPATATSARHKPERRKLPAERLPGWTSKFNYADGETVFITLNPYEDGSPGELFIHAGKHGDTLGAFVGNLAKAVSIGLQYGVPMPAYIDAFLHEEFAPNGIVVGHPEIAFCKSVVDLIFRHIGIRHFGMTELGHRQAPTATALIQNGAEVSTVEKLIAPPQTAAAAFADVSATRPTGRLVLGEKCPSCGQHSMVQTGTCKTCKSCTYSSGGCG